MGSLSFEGGGGTQADRRWAEGFAARRRRGNPRRHSSAAEKPAWLAPKDASSLYCGLLRDTICVSAMAGHGELRADWRGAETSRDDAAGTGRGATNGRKRRRLTEHAACNNQARSAFPLLYEARTARADDPLGAASDLLPLPYRKRAPVHSAQQAFPHLARCENAVAYLIGRHSMLLSKRTRALLA